MPLLLDDLRKEFAQFLIESPEARFRMDAALVHVITIAYKQGLEEGRACCAQDVPGESQPPDRT